MFPGEPSGPLSFTPPAPPAAPDWGGEGHGGTVGLEHCCTAIASISGSWCVGARCAFAAGSTTLASRGVSEPPAGSSVEARTAGRGVAALIEQVHETACASLAAAPVLTRAAGAGAAVAALSSICSVARPRVEDTVVAVGDQHATPVTGVSAPTAVAVLGASTATVATIAGVRTMTGPDAALAEVTTIDERITSFAAVTSLATLAASTCNASITSVLTLSTVTRQDVERPVVGVLAMKVLTGSAGAARSTGLAWSSVRCLGIRIASVGTSSTRLGRLDV